MDKPDKPLKEWTLGEAKEFCNAKESCSRCELACKLESGNYLCVISDEPDVWDLDDEPKYTADEIALAKLLMKAGVEAVQKDGLDGTTMLWTSSEKFSRVSVNLFPSVELMSEQIEVKDIAESKARNG